MQKKMHAGEFEIDAHLVRRLLSEQFPEWANLPIKELSGGTANFIYRLGDDMTVRLPRVSWSAWEVDVLKEHHEWLRRLAPKLPLAIPTPLALGMPSNEYPSAWAVHTWIEGDALTADNIADLHQVAAVLADFVGALQQVDPKGAPLAYRQGPLSEGDRGMRAAIQELHGTIDTGLATEAWDASLRAPDWHGSPVWIHSDLLPGNLLVAEGRLTAVIDFEICGLGDPAHDICPAWNVLSGDTRPIFRSMLHVDEATWLRARGRALGALRGMNYYKDRNPAFAAMLHRTVNEVFYDFANGL